MRQVHEYKSKLVVRVHRHNQKHTFMHADTWGPPRGTTPLSWVFTCTKSYSIPQIHNLKHSSNTLHYSVLYQSINNLSPTHTHTRKSWTGRSGMCSKITWVKGWPPCECTNMYKGLCAQTHTLSHTQKIWYCLQVLFNNACLNEALSILLWSCPYACSLSRTLAGAAL